MKTWLFLLVVSISTPIVAAPPTKSPARVLPSRPPQPSVTGGPSTPAVPRASTPDDPSKYSYLHPLLKIRADARELSPHDKGVIMIALADKGDIPGLTALVAAGADVNYLSEIHQTPLHWAIFANRLDVVRWLLERDADPNIKTVKGYSALDIANAADKDPKIYALIKQSGGLPGEQKVKGPYGE